MAITIAILAGGASSRMGQDKALVTIGDRPIIAHMLAAIHQLADVPVMVITHKPELFAQFEVPLYSDVLPGHGSLGGIYSALAHSTTTHTMVLGCDMPFLNADFMAYMCHLRLIIDRAFDGVVPFWEGFPQALHAIYGKSCMPAIRARLEQKMLKIVALYEDIQPYFILQGEVEEFDLEGKMFQNLNTPEDLERARHRHQNQSLCGKG